MDYRRIFSSTLSISGRLMSNFYPICERFPSSAKTVGFARGIKSTSFFILNKNHGNTIVSAHGTGYEYIPNPYDGQAHPTRTRAMIYSNSCLCAMNSTGTTQACFTINNSSGTVSITGLRMGCIPSESFLVSNLESLFDASYILVILSCRSGRVRSTILSNRSLRWSDHRFPVDLSHPGADLLQTVHAYPK